MVCLSDTILQQLMHMMSCQLYWDLVRLLITYCELLWVQLTDVLGAMLQSTRTTQQ